MRRSALSEMQQDALEKWCDEVDISQVLPKYQGEVHRFCSGVVSLYNPLPSLLVHFGPSSSNDFYNIYFRGFYGEVSVAFLYSRMIFRETRDACFKGVQNVTINPHTNSVKVGFWCASETRSRRESRKSNAPFRRALVPIDQPRVSRTQVVTPDGTHAPYLETVDEAHRHIVKTAVNEIRYFDDSSAMPPIDSISVINTPSRYKICIKVNHDFDIAKLHHVFLDPGTRSPDYNNVSRVYLDTRIRMLCIRVAKPRIISKRLKSARTPSSSHRSKRKSRHRRHRRRK